MYKFCDVIPHRVGPARVALHYVLARRTITAYQACEWQLAPSVTTDELFRVVTQKGMPMYEPQALASTETYLIHVLENSNPPRDVSHFDITAAAKEFYDTTGGWDIESAETSVVEDVLTHNGK